ncbi:SdrD B-like domain-containing protein [Methylobacillus glycogenes]|uniref:SdrD B-like domain-containing protein n=1 Tax=Methylobacillus glycogenes TaxID=406 RepID=UPI0004706EB7|nr:SdrD B-like domain-containing protein [Methylobacillus glycogenes]
MKVTPDPTFDCSDIIGKVFDDKNANGYQDQGEPGIANVRVVTARGLLVTTDAEGRFHVTCADIPQMDRGSNFVMKLDERTLPSGYRVTTENPRDVRVTRGKMVKLNFGATVHRVVRVDINDAAFLPAGLELQPQWQQAFEDMLHKLEGRPSVLRIAFAANTSNANDKAQPSLTKKRLDSLAKLARKRWREMHEKPNQQQEQAAFPLIVETAVEAVEGETQP